MIVATTWKQVLKLKALPSIYDSFFELGGDSISAIIVASRVTSAGAPLSVRVLTQAKTIAQISFTLIGTPHEASDAPAVALKSMPLLEAPQKVLASSQPFNLSPIQFWFFGMSGIEDKNHWNYSHLVPIPNTTTTEQVRAATKKLIAHHDALRLQFFRIDRGVLMQHYLECTDLLLEKACVLVEDIASELNAAASAIETSFELRSDDPLFKVALLHNLADGNKYVHFAQHHLISDNLSSPFPRDLPSSTPRLELNPALYYF